MLKKERKEEMTDLTTKDLENKIRTLFENEDIGKCSERFLNTTRYVANGSEEAYRYALELRLRQGGMLLSN